MNLPVKNEHALIVSGNEWSAMREQCSMLVKSGFLPAAIKTPEQALAVALKGHEIRVPMMQSFSQINVIQGKPAVSAELQLALIYRNIPGAKVEFERLEADGCTILATRPNHKPVTISFTKTDAEAAQLLNKDNWKKYPRAMYRSRAIAEMARSIFPDAIMGCSYTPEELGASVNESGEVIEVTPIKVAPAINHETHTEESKKEESKKEESKTAPDPPKATKKPPYDGSTEHQKVLEKMLREQRIDEVFWDDINKSMIGKNFADLKGVVEKVIMS